MSGVRYGLIPHPTEPRLLLLSTPDGWSLPSYPEREARDVTRVIHERFGLHVTVLRYAPRFDTLENHNPDWGPDAAGRWVTAGELAALPLAEEVQRPALESWFREPAPVLPHQPWSQPGWFDRAVAWIRANGGCGPVEQIHLRPNSCVLHVGDLYFKAVAGIDAAEPAVTALLAARFPDLVPAVVAHEPEQRWMLQRDGGQPLRSLTRGPADLPRWEPVLRAFARMQIATAGMLDALLAAGMEDRRLASLPARYQSLVASPRLLGPAHPDGIPEAELAAMRARAGEVQGLCDQVAGFQIPDALHHDDFHANNIMVRGERFGVIDWGESTIGHPFGSLYMALRYAAYLCDLPEDHPAVIALRDAYLDEWTAFEPLPRLVELYAGAARLQMLSRALTWHAFMPSVAPDLLPEYQGAAEYWLRLFMGFDPD